MLFSLSIRIVKFPWISCNASNPFLKDINIKLNSRFSIQWVENSVGSNISNFELLRTWEAELRTLSNPGLSTKNELRTLLNPCKLSELRTCSARYRSNPRPNLEKPNFEPFWTQVRQLKSNCKTTRTLQKSQTSNPWTGFDPTLIGT